MATWRMYRQAYGLRRTVVAWIRHQCVMAPDRAVNRWWDVRARLGGYCNHRPWDPPKRHGGYSHWRCARRHGHPGMHRFLNYVWNGVGDTEYSPIEAPVAQPWDRHMGMTLRQQRRWDRETNAAERRRRHERRLAAEQPDSG